MTDWIDDYATEDFHAYIAANRAVMEWIDADPSLRLVGCTPAMVAQVAVDAYRKAAGSPASPQPQPVPHSATIRRDLAHLIDRYHLDAADADQHAAITNLASLLRHSMACNLALTTEIEHYAQDAAEARTELAEVHAGERWVDSSVDALAADREAAQS